MASASPSPSASASALKRFSIEHALRVIIHARKQDTPEAYTDAQRTLEDELAKPGTCPVHAQRLQQLCELTEDHRQAFEACITNFELDLRTHFFVSNVQKAVDEGDLLAQMMVLTFPPAAGESPSLAIRVAAAAQRGDLMAKLMVAQYSRTEEELEEMGKVMIPVRIVRADEL